MRRKVLARSVRSVVEMLEGRIFLSASLAENAGTALVSGVAYNDLNGNGVQDAGEPALPGANITLSQVGVTYAAGAVPTVQADVNGAFSFTSLAAGQYTLALVADPGYTADAPGSLNISVAPNVSAQVNIGETTNAAAGGSGTASLTGTLFHDANSDGTFQSATEDFLSGDTVYLDLDGSGTFKANDPTAVTNNTGHYTFDGIAPGSYLVRVIPRIGFHQDAPGYSQVTLYSDQAITQNIGETNLATISGVIFQDNNGDGIQEAGELAIAGEVVFLDLNLDGFAEPGIQNPSTGLWDTDPATGGNEPFARSDTTGHFQISGLTPGVYRVIIESNLGLIQDAPGYIDVTLTQGQNYTLNVPEAIGASISGTVFDDRNANGTLDTGEPGLANQSVFLDLNDNGIFDEQGLGGDGLPLNGAEPLTTTDANGQFNIANLGPGTYTLRLETPNGGLATAPANSSHSYTFTLASNQIVTGLNLGFETPDLTATILNYPTKPTLTNVKKQTLVRVTDVGSLPVNGLVGVSLWAQTNNGIVDETSAFLIGVLPGKNIHLAVGQSHTFKVPFYYPMQMPLNTYYISAQVVSTVNDNDPGNDFSAPVGPVQVGPPTIDLNLTYAVQPKLIVDPGQPTGVSLLLANNGNVTTNGTLGFRFYLSNGPVVEPDDVVVQTLIIHGVHIKPGKSKIFNLELPFPKQSLGVRYINVAVDSGDKLGEQNLLNNFALSEDGTRFD